MKNTSSKVQTQEKNTPFDVLIGRAAMLGFVFALGAYLTADILAPGFV